VQGGIDQNLVYRLTPQIVALQSRSRDPITIYIDSPGGLVTYMESLLDLLRASNQQNEPPCRLITVAISQAASAAADLLAAGNYALAYPHSTILYHGVRIPGDRALTVEETLQLAQRLRVGNETYAMQLAREAEFRAVFRFISLKSQFQGIRDENPEKTLTDLECFITVLSGKLSVSANEVLEKARERHSRYNDLLGYVLDHTKSPEKFKTKAEMEAADIKAIVDFERKQNKKDKDWSFQSEGIHRLTDDFYLLYEYLKMFNSARLQKLCGMFAPSLLSAEQLSAINDTTPEEERPLKIAEAATPQLRPIWTFFVALCHVLQQGENQLTGTDAFWLGLIDEVVGIKELPSFRLFIEFAQQRAEAAKGQVNGEEAVGTAAAAPAIA
jgi:ATP-dependent protease ClpP protease subunit